MLSAIDEMVEKQLAAIENPNFWTLNIILVYCFSITIRQ